KNFGYFLLSLHLTLFQNYPEQVVIQELHLVIYTFFLLLFLYLFFFYNCQTLLELATFYLLIDCFATGFHSILFAKEILQPLHRLQLLVLPRCPLLPDPSFPPCLPHAYIFLLPYSFPSLVRSQIHSYH